MNASQSTSTGWYVHVVCRWIIFRELAILAYRLNPPCSMCKILGFVGQVCITNG